MAATKKAARDADLFTASPKTRALAVAKLEASGLCAEDLQLLKLRLVDNAQALHPNFQPVPALVIPYFEPDQVTPMRMPDGARVFFQVRYLEAPNDFSQVADADARRYDQEPDSGTHAYFPPAVAWAKKERAVRIITEGAWKAAAACARGFPTIALQGVDCFSAAGDPTRLLPELEAATYADSVTLLFDSDPVAKPAARKGVARALARLATLLRRKGLTVRVKRLPSDGQAKVGLDDFLLSLGPTLDAQTAAFAAWLALPPDAAAAEDEEYVSPKQQLQDWWYVATEDRYYHLTTRRWVLQGGINASVAPIRDPSTGDYVQAATLVKDHRIDSVTWHPNEPKIIPGRVVVDGEWQEAVDCTTLNTYNGSKLASGDAKKAKPWVDFVKRLYPADADHLIRWLAFKAQHPGIKLQHALVLGGSQGIGKDTLLAPIGPAIGQHNYQNLSPHMLTGDYNPHVKSVILVIDEAADSGADDRAQLDKRKFYESMKTLIASTASPTLLVNEKYLQQHRVFNVLGVIYTTNTLFGSIYLPSDDRRHYVAWSQLKKEELRGAHKPLYAWYDAGGFSHVAAYLRTLDLSTFDPNEPPPQTEAWKQMVAYEAPPSDSELADTLEKLGNPAALTIETLLFASDSNNLKDQLSKARVAVTVLAKGGYTRVANAGEKSGRWLIQGAKAAVYARSELGGAQRILAATALTKRAEPRVKGKKEKF